MAVPKPKPFELRFAYRLLQALGGNTTNMYLILAIVAWVRSESGTRYIGNNPLNLRPGSDDLRFRAGTRASAGNGRFSVYKNLTDAARATANRLKNIGSWAGYDKIIKAARWQMPDGLSKTEKDLWLQKQARDFLYNVAKSKWSSTHYGYGRKPDPNMSEADLFTKNRIIGVWVGIVNGWGNKVQLPKDSPIQPKKPVPVPKQPRTLAHMVPTRAYLLPYEAYSFYTQRREEPPVVPEPSPMPEW